MNALQTAKTWQKQLDREVALIVFEDEHSFIRYDSNLKTYQICVHGTVNATVIGSGTLSGCQRVADKIAKNPQYLKNFC